MATIQTRCLSCGGPVHVEHPLTSDVLAAARRQTIHDRGSYFLWGLIAGVAISGIGALTLLALSIAG